MNTDARREQLINYLADAADKKVNALYALLEDDIKANTFTFTGDHMAILEQRRADYLSGKSIASSWQEAHEESRINEKMPNALYDCFTTRSRR